MTEDPKPIAPEELKVLVEEGFITEEDYLRLLLLGMYTEGFLSEEQYERLCKS